MILPDSEAPVARAVFRPTVRGRLSLAAPAVALLFGACVEPGGADRFTAVADVPELMAHVIEPAAQEYWGAVGWILDEDGEHELRPSNEEEWLRVENAAFMVAESGNLLMMDERAQDAEAWMAMSEALVQIGRRAVEVAEAKDEQGVFDVGAEMYYVCTNCHATYAVETLRPSDDRSGGSDGGS